MTPASSRSFFLPLLAMIACALGGCAGVAVSDGGYTPIYGDYGYVGPWDGYPLEVAGGYYAAPPYARYDPHRQREETVRRQPDSRERGPFWGRVFPVRRPQPPRPIPSIPNQPRPTRKGGEKKAPE